MYAEILVNHAYARIKERLSYKIPEGMELQTGSGVVVPFQKGQKAGIVLDLSPSLDSGTDLNKIKEVEALLVPEILLYPWQIELSEWISKYYFCSKLDVFKMMLPKNIWRVPKRARTTKTKEKTIKALKHHKLTDEQMKIKKAILESSKKVALIRGITGSGKTEIYKHLAHEISESGKQVLLLVPEISLTPQLVHEFEGLFPGMQVIHSKLSDGKRASAWRKIQSGETKLIVGSRSALFSPFKNLGLIIMDEEHEWTYKQDQSPRYQAHSVAEKIIELTDSKLVLGSATPRLESMYKAQTGTYDYYELNKRIQNTALPKVEVVDMRLELQKKNYTMFSDALLDGMQSKLSKGEQCILFLNRRGTASASTCRDCGLSLSCKDCDVKLTYHSRPHSNAILVCHHCGWVTSMSKNCPDCNSGRIKQFGLGTERVESELKKLFPKAKIWRADRDSMNQVDSHEKLYEALKKGEIDILIGTQMVSKGLDIPNVSLVGVILADMGLHIPDFRAGERAFQLLTQVAGRAGRRETQGEVIIQSYCPEHPSIQFSKNHDYLGFYEQEISTREGSLVPPFAKLIKLIQVNENKEKAREETEKLYMKLHELNKKIEQTGARNEIYRAPALIPRKHRKYHWNILIQSESPRLLIETLDAEDLKGWRIDVEPIQVI